MNGIICKDYNEFNTLNTKASLFFNSTGGLCIKWTAPAYTSDGKIVFAVEDRIMTCLDSEDISRIENIDFTYTKPAKLAAFENAVAAGFDTGLGFKMSLTDADRNQFTQLMTLLTTACEPDSQQVTFADIDGQVHIVTFGEFKQLIGAYGKYYHAIWSQYKS